jgi:RimJ/RimL family protein N-acetyltransferase
MALIDRHPGEKRIADILRMVIRLCVDSGCGRWWEADESDTMDLILGCHNRDRGYCAVVIDEQSNKTAGCLVGFIGELPFNHKVLVSREVALWVDPEHRGKALGDLIVNDFMAWSKENGASMVSIGSTYGFGEEHIKKIADANGFELHERMYLRRV